MNPILETAFGLIFIFMIFSLITSWIVEYLSMIYQRRGNMLYKYLKGALNDNFNKNWGLMLYAHPLIEALGREIHKSNSLFGFLQNNKIGLRKRLPQYIPSEQFSAALIDLIIDNNRSSIFIKDEHGQYITLKKPLQPEKAYQDFLNGLDSLNESEMKSMLLSLSRTASGQPDPFLALKAEIATWYNNSMDRVNGWYKRATRKWLFLTGFLVAMFCNVNSIEILTRLYTDPQIRASVAQTADTYLLQNEKLPEGVAGSADSLRSRINELRNILTPLQLPIGYTYKHNGFKEMLPEYLCAVKQAFGPNFLGWLITAFAVSFGAPFWFDILKRFANIRSAGISPGSRENKPLIENKRTP